MEKNKKQTRLAWLKQVLCDEMGCAYLPTGEHDVYRFKRSGNGLNIEITAPKRKDANWVVWDFSEDHPCDYLEVLERRYAKSQSSAIAQLIERIHSREQAVKDLERIPQIIANAISKLSERISDLESEVRSIQDWRNG